MVTDTREAVGAVPVPDARSPSCLRWVFGHMSLSFSSHLLEPPICSLGVNEMVPWKP